MKPTKCLENKFWRATIKKLNVQNSKQFRNCGTEMFAELI